MPELTASLLQDIGNSWLIARAWFDAILPALKITSVIISGLCIYGIIHAIVKSDYMTWVIDRMVDMAGSTDVPQQRARREWTRAIRLIQNATDRAAWIEALKKADKIMNEGLKIQGYKALNADDRIRIAVETGALNTGEEMQNAHALLNQTVQNPNGALTHEMAVRALRTYKKVIKELGFKI